VVLSAFTSLLMLLSPEIMQALQAFMLGNTSTVGWSACALMAVPLALAALVAWALSPALDALALGEATATSLGIPLPVMRMALVATLGLATGAAVAQTGLVAFVGLAAPHLARSLVKVTHGRLILLAAGTGGVLLLAADILARWLIAPQELPVGVLTAVLGGTYLLWLMRQRTRAGGAL
jgi:iron complex transport system permease protein